VEDAGSPGAARSSAAGVRHALADLSAGRPVVLRDDRSDEAHLVAASEHVTAEQVAFLVRYSAGFLSVAMTAEDADRLDLPPVVPGSDASGAAVAAVAVDAREGIDTGISARDRARTIHLLAAPATSGADLARPGHVVPVRVGHGGVLRHPGVAESAVDLCALAGLRPCATLGALVSERHPVRMAGGPEVQAFADEHRLSLVSIDDLVAHRWRFDILVERVAEARMPLAAGAFTAVGYRGLVDGRESIALVHGDVRAGEVPVHVHPECLAGDVLGSSWCECGAGLQAALGAVVANGRGVVLYQRAPATGNAALGTECVAGRPADTADLTGAVQVLRDLGVEEVRLVGGDAGRRRALEEHGLAVVG
jgi:3,4-dihydroxy 2-butanone 4-phosphate synthase/GTP cyclohydrolase II